MLRELFPRISTLCTTDPTTSLVARNSFKSILYNLNYANKMKTQSKNHAQLGENEDNQMALRRLQMRRTLRELQAVKGVGTSLITLLVPSTGSLQRVLTKLHDELALSAQIQSRV